MSEPDNASLSQNEVYDLLSNARRRFVISHLRERGEPVDIMELSETVAAWENDVERDELTDQQIKRVYVSLYQTHVPKLRESGIVEYDKEESLVTLTSNVTELDTYLPEHERRQIPWQMLYLGLAIVGLVVYGIALLVPLTLPLTAIGIVLLCLFGALAVAQYELTRR